MLKPEDELSIDDIRSLVGDLTMQILMLKKVIRRLGSQQGEESKDADNP